jgi:hypothetical protein
LQRTPAGRVYWDEHGQTMPMRLDLRTGSRSMRKFTAALAQLGWTFETVP